MGGVSYNSVGTIKALNSIWAIMAAGVASSQCWQTLITASVLTASFSSLSSTNSSFNSGVRVRVTSFVFWYQGFGPYVHMAKWGSCLGHLGQQICIQQALRGQTS